ncbi:hypothetical protein Q2T40_04005 [Winogradskyella maritima]|nr:hypothetical protein [Winogradskyella maritima]
MRFGIKQNGTLISMVLLKERPRYCRFKSWTPELGNNAVAPRWESASNFSTNTVGNSWYVEDGTYVRLQRIGLSYDFRELTERLGLTKLKIGLAANNIWTITNYGGIDPGVGGGVDTNFGIDIGNYPVSPPIFNQL